MNGFIYETIVSLRYLGIAILMIIFSNEAIMPYVGFSAYQGTLNLAAAIAAGTLGSTVGSTMVYLIARLFDRKKVTRWLSKYGKWLGINPRRIDRAGKLFDTHARQTVFFGRFIPGIRTAVSVPAGYQRMPAGQFVLFTFLGSLLSSTILAMIGYYLRQGFNKIDNFATIFSYVLGGIVIIVIAVIALKKSRASSSR